MSDRVFAEAAGLAARARRPAVFTGAGMSRDSGLRTFRGEEGHWRTHRAEDLATPEALQRDPVTVWQWYAERLACLEGVTPHAGYLALVRWERSAGSLPVLTQNIDGLHSAAGSGDVTELHGTIRTASCTRCRGGRRRVDRSLLADLPPRCECGSVLRPDVVLFGEPLPREALLRAEEAARMTDLMVVVGTSMTVYPAASIPWTALSRGAAVIEINPCPTELSSAPGVLHIPTGAAEGLTRLLEKR